MALYHAKKKELEGNTKEVEKAQNTPSSVAYRYKFKAGVRINGKVYNSQSSLSDILLLKKHNYALFSRYFGEVVKPITNEKKEENKAVSEPDVEFYADNTDGTIRKEVKDALGNEIE